MSEITFTVSPCDESSVLVAAWDAPGGGGKVPVNPEYVLCRNAGRVLIRNYEGKVFEYPESADGLPLTKPKQIEEPELA